MDTTVQQKSDFPKRLSHNELPYPPPTDLLELLSSHALNRYPSSDYEELRLSLAQLTGQSPKDIVVANGSDECIRLIIDAFSKPKEAVIIPTPTFTQYEIISSIGYRTPVLMPQKGFRFQLKEIESESIKQKAALIFICSPNNPTGLVVEENELRSLLQNTQSIVVLDEAYVEFSNQKMLHLISEFDRLIIMRTLSKAYGLAGIRLGYCLSQEKNIQKLRAARAPFSISSVSAALGKIGVDLSQKYLGATQEIIISRDEFIASLSGFNCLKVYPSQANFVLLRIEERFEALIQSLKSNGIEIRVFENALLKNHLRITIGDSQTMKEISCLIKEIYHDL